LSLLGLAQLYPGYDYEQVTIVASRIPDTIVAFGQTRHNMFPAIFFLIEILGNPELYYN
jgi:hypothetical protein